MRGFTLIEIMVVVVIIGLLATFGGVHVIESFVHGQREIALAKCKEYYDQAHLWEMETKKLPASIQDMAAPVRPGERNFVRPVPDPWGNPYVLEPDGRDIRIRSWGEDRREGSDDDLVWVEDRSSD